MFSLLFLIAMRLIHPLFLPLTRMQQDQLIKITSFFGIHDAEIVYIMTLVLSDIILALAAYISIKFLLRIVKK